MKLRDYNRIIDLVEDNITIEKDVLSEMVDRMIGMTERRSAEFFQIFHEEERTVKQYIVERKVGHALEDFAAGKTMEQVSEKYNYSLSSLGKAMRNYTNGKTPQEVRKEGFVCPAPLYLENIVPSRGVSLNSGPHISDGESFKNELISLIDENTRLRDELSEERLNARNAKSEVGTRMLNKETYRKFLELENLRISYGFSVEDIIRLKKTSERSGRPLRELCDEKLDYLFFKEDDQEAEYDGDFEIERLNYHDTYEMNTAEAWNLYYGDDGYDTLEEDPYAEDPYEIMDHEDISDAGLDDYYSY